MAMAGVTEQIRASIFVMATVAIIVAVVAQSPPSSSGCTTALVSLSPCLGYVTSNSTTSPPSQSCCSALSSVVQTNAMCLCQLLSGNNPLGISINQKQALSLPQACNVTTPAASQCKAADTPAAAPVPVPVPSPSGGGLSNGPSPRTESAPSPAPATSTSTPSPTAASPPANTQPSGVPPPAPSTSTSTPSPTAASPSANTNPSGVPPTSSVGGISPAGKSNDNPTINAAGGHFIISRIVGLLAAVIVVSVVW